MGRRVIDTAPKRWVISAMGVRFEPGLLSWFLQKYGQKGTEKYTDPPGPDEEIQRKSYAPSRKTRTHLSHFLPHSRINVLPLHIPPLRERKEDIPLLARRFIASHSSKQGSGSREIPQEAIDRIVAYDWPGNVRELENMIQRGLLASNGSEFKLPALETTISSDPRRVGLKRLDEVERDHILRTLEARGWKVRGPGGTAEVLGMNPSTLR